MHMSVVKEAIIIATFKFNTPLELCICTNTPIHHAERFHTYRKCPNKMDPDIAENVKRSIQ